MLYVCVCVCVCVFVCVCVCVCVVYILPDNVGWPPKHVAGNWCAAVYIVSEYVGFINKKCNFVARIE
jgi:hypothetical protein